MAELINTDQTYRILSLYHTHKKDKFITLWGPNSAGYHYSQEMSGVYEGYQPGYHESERSMPIIEELASTLFQKVIYEGKEKHMIKNSAKNRKVLGLVWDGDNLVRKDESK